MNNRKSIIGRLRDAGAILFGERRSENILHTGNWGDVSTSDITVTEQTALSVPAVFACVKLLSQTTASLPLFVYERTKKGKKRADNHPVYNLLHDSPNYLATAFDFRYAMMFNMLMSGYGFAKIIRNNRGDVAELWNIPSQYVYVKQNSQTGKVYFEVRRPRKKLEIILFDEMLVIPWSTKDGLSSYRPIQLARDTIGMSIAAEQYGSYYFANGSNPGGIIQIPKGMRSEVVTRLKGDLREKYNGLGKSHKLMFLEDDVTYKDVDMKPQDSQLIESRKFQVIEIARFFNVPPHLIMDLERATFSNIEQQSISFVQNSLRPYLVMIEQRYMKHLLTDTERKKYFIEHNVDGLLRGDYKSRTEGYAKGIQSSWLSINDVRKLENMDPIEGGDVHLAPINYMPLTTMVQEPTNDQRKADQPRELRKEERQKQAAMHRHRIVGSYREKFNQAINNAVKLEVKDIRQAVKEHLRQRSEGDFEEWLKNYYNDENTQKRLNDAVRPVFNSLATDIYGVASEEAGNGQTFDGRAEKFIDKYTMAYVNRHTGSSSGQLRKLTTAATANGRDVADDIEERLNEWEEKRSDKEAANETVKLAGAIARLAFLHAGVRYIRWINTGSDSCPYCTEMDGQVMGIDQNFVDKFSEVFPDAVDSGMTAYNNVGHPPLHAGCQCTIVAE